MPWRLRISQLAYLADLGVKAIWLSPVLKNSKPDFEFNYQGYETQDFVKIDERFPHNHTRIPSRFPRRTRRRWSSNGHNWKPPSTKR